MLGEMGVRLSPSVAKVTFERKLWGQAKALTRSMNSDEPRYFCRQSLRTSCEQSASHGQLLSHILNRLLQRHLFRSSRPIETVAVCVSVFSDSSVSK